MEAVKVSEGYHLCPSCLGKMVENQFRLCFGCERKWWKVYGDCCSHGWSEDIARCKADDAYPGRY